MYSYHWLPGSMVTPELLTEFADVYSGHYGIWGDRGSRPGEHVKLGPKKVRTWLEGDTYIVWASLLGEVIGYAITAQSSAQKLGQVAWVTQLVVHEEHRQKDVGKTLLFTAWKFTDFFAWGLLSANPFAIRALEKATRRRCLPNRIQKNVTELKEFGSRFVHYVSAETELVVTAGESRIDTQFFLDHSRLPEMLKAVDDDDHPWALGRLPEGWEWFAFTFRDQQQISLSSRELEEMLRASDEVTKAAYARMLLDSPSQKWATHTKREVDFILEQFADIAPKRILDFGCGMG